MIAMMHVLHQVSQRALYYLYTAAEERRKYPPYKAISIIHNKQRQHYLTNRVKPKLLPDLPGKIALSRYAAVYV
jgi:hypothetical protein